MLEPHKSPKFLIGVGGGQKGQELGTCRHSHIRSYDLHMTLDGLFMENDDVGTFGNDVTIVT